MEHLGFEDLEVYGLIRTFTRDVYDLVSRFPQEERFALCDQLRRSIISVGSNLAEGYGRYSVREKFQFVSIANGSLYESYYQLQIALDLGYITPSEFEQRKDDIYRISRMLQGLKNFYEKSL